ncbi:MAG TPA: UMP kinase [Thermoplasmata archaeon]|nr:UMP kinase [Thermoplasmata archaeon]
MARREPSEVRPVVVSVGGSVLLTGDDDAGYLDRLASLLRRLGREMPLVVTTGGGRTAREYIGLGRRLDLTEVELDELGIDVTRLHARLLAARIGAPTPAHPPTTLREVVHELARASPVVLGGTEPGHTTDAVAALVAVRVRAARMVNATNVDGLYDHDPRTHPDARRVETISWADFRALVHGAATGAAGENFPFDRLGADSLARAKIPLSIVQGRNLVALEAAMLGRPFDGTRVG